MKTTFTLAALTGLLSAASAEYFSLTAARSASPIHYAPVTASGQQIWLNKDTASYCPDNISSCPPGNTTVFAGGSGQLSMGVVVPGGQQVYIEPETGALKYTQAHSAAVPEGAIREGWSTEARDGFGVLSNKAGGLVACPCEEGDAYKVFVALKDVEFDEGCLGFSALAGNVTAAGAWQYS